MVALNRKLILNRIDIAIFVLETIFSFSFEIIEEDQEHIAEDVVLFNSTTDTQFKY
jgi:hypothetical protein